MEFQTGTGFVSVVFLQETEDESVGQWTIRFLDFLSYILIFPSRDQTSSVENAAPANAIPRVARVIHMTTILVLQRALLPEAERVPCPPPIGLLPMPFPAVPAQR